MKTKTRDHWEAMVCRNVARAQGCAVRMLDELADGDDELDEDEAQSFEQLLDQEIATLVRRRGQGWN